MTRDSEERNEHVMTLAQEALRTSARERDSFLRSACPNDPDLYRDVSEVVAWEERMGGFLNRSLVEIVDLEALEKIFRPEQVVSGRFEILRRVGEGGMGVVYEAFDRKRKQRVAIKFAKPGFGRLLSPELEGALKVSHRNICRVNEIHTTETEYGELDFLTMEFLDGETLSRRLEKGKLNQAEALEIARQLCAGIAEAHHSSVLHLDLKPGNVILCRSHDGSTRAVITDFGLSTHAAGPGEVGGGTPAYMAPELWKDGKPSQASDVFSLGVVLYEMVTGQKPFPTAAKDDGAAHVVVAPSKLVKNLPGRWDKAILSCLQLNPEQRPSAQEVLSILEHKPFYLRLAPLVAITACLVIAVLLAPRIIGIFTAPPNHLALLPLDAGSELTQSEQTVLNDVAERVKQMQLGKASMSVIPLSETLRKNIGTPEQAKKDMGATHVLEVKFLPQANGLAIQGTIVDLRTMAQVGEYSGRFAQADLADLRTGLTGFVSWSLGLNHASQPEAVAPEAAGAYKTGREDLNREPPDFAHALSAFEEAARLDLHSPLPLAGEAEAYARKYLFTGEEKAKDYAQRQLGMAEALNADSPSVRMAAGLLHAIEGNNAGALKDYQRVEKIEPANAEAWIGSGLAYELLGQDFQDKAIADYIRAIDIAPNYYKPYEYLGALHFHDGRYSKAEEMFKNDVKYAPDREGAYGSLAGVYIAQGKFFDAEEVYKESLQKKESAVMLNNIGVMRAIQKDQKGAEDFYQRAVNKKDGNIPYYWLNLGDAQRRLNEKAKAKASYQHARELAKSLITKNTANAETWAHLAYLDARLGFTKDAQSEILTALNSPGKDDQVIQSAVETYEVLGDPKQALDAAKMATPQTRNLLDNHPDLTDLQADPQFRSLIVKPK
jgi:eukaryotic-like serine/threonine-protein kinase